MQSNPVWSEELLALLDRLTIKQRAAVLRLAIHLAQGGSVDSLLSGPTKICARQTYYGRPNGWSHQPDFQEALSQAQREYRQVLAADSVEQVRNLLFKFAPEALERTVQIMRQAEETAQARLAARDLWREVLKASGLAEEEDDVTVTFEAPDWAEPDDPAGD